MPPGKTKKASRPAPQPVITLIRLQFIRDGTADFHALRGDLLASRGVAPHAARRICGRGFLRRIRHTGDIAFQDRFGRDKFFTFRLRRMRPPNAVRYRSANMRGSNAPSCSSKNSSGDLDHPTAGVEDEV
jgi:hypothetical protein